MKINITKILQLFAVLSLLLCGATGIYYLSEVNSWGTITTGRGVRPSGNIGFFVTYAVLAFTIASLFFALVEVGFLIDYTRVSIFAYPILRGCVYVLLGVGWLGVCSDLGIASGIILITTGSLIFITHFVKCA